MSTSLSPLRLASLFLLPGLAAACVPGSIDPDIPDTGGAGGAVTTGTGGASDGGAGPGGSDGGTGGAGTGGMATGGADACAGYQGQATSTEIALSPFADEEAEMLAIEATGELVAPEHVYQRIVSDLAQIRAQNDAVQSISAMEGWVPGELLMGFDDIGFAAVKDGTYTDWDCANAHYGFTGANAKSFYVLVSFDHRFNVPLLANEYAQLPHVEYAEPNGFAGDGNDVCVSIDKEKYSYVFDAGSGDCPAGCIQHVYWGYSTEGTPVQVTSLGTFSNAQGTPPAWFTALGDCTKWL